MLVQHDPKVTGSLTHLFEPSTAIAQQVDERHTLGIEQLEREALPFSGVLDPCERVRDVAEQVLAAAQVAALVA